MFLVSGLWAWQRPDKDPASAGISHDNYHAVGQNTACITVGIYRKFLCKFTCLFSHSLSGFSPSALRPVLELSNCNLTSGVFLLKASDPWSVFKFTSSYVNLVHSLRTVGFGWFEGVEGWGNGMVYIGSCGWFCGGRRVWVIPAK